MAKLERHMFCGSDLEMRQEINAKGELCGNQESPDEQKLWMWKSAAAHPTCDLFFLTLS